MFFYALFLNNFVNLILLIKGSSGMLFAINNVKVTINTCDQSCVSCSNNGTCLSCDAVNGVM